MAPESALEINASVLPAGGLSATLSFATGVLTEAEVDRLEAALETFGEHAYMEGVFVRGPEAPPGASRQERVLARMGRGV